MAKPEEGLWKFLRVRMPVGGHYTRIESNETAPGFPDVHYTLSSPRDRTGGIELKCNPLPTTYYPFAGDKHGLRKSQLIWIADELYAGGKVVLCLQARETIYWVDGIYFKEIATWNVHQLLHHAQLTWERGGSCDVEALADFLTKAP